jgi:hypothetical protein
VLTGVTYWSILVFFVSVDSVHRLRAGTLCTDDQRNVQRRGDRAAVRELLSPSCYCCCPACISRRVIGLHESLDVVQYTERNTLTPKVGFWDDDAIPAGVVLGPPGFAGLGRSDVLIAL